MAQTEERRSKPPATSDIPGLTKVVEYAASPPQSGGRLLTTNYDLLLEAAAGVQCLPVVLFAERNESLVRFWTERRAAKYLAHLAQSQAPDFDLASGEVVAHPPRPEGPRVADLEDKMRQLQLENGRLQSRVAEERRVAARETRQHDQLKAQFDQVLNHLRERDHANEALQAAMIARNDARLRMFEAYEGEVVHVHDDRVVAVFEVGDDLVEQTYLRDQFLDKQLPRKGDRLAVYVHVAQLPPEPLPRSGEDANADESNEQPRRRKHVIPLPRTFG